MGSEGGISKSRVRHGTIRTVPAASAQPKPQRKEMERRAGRTTKNPGSTFGNRKPKRNGLWNGYEADGVTRIVCRNCHTAQVNRPRGLCWACYYTPGVKERFASKSRYTRRGVGLQAGALPLDTLICPYLPGTEGKVRFMEDRAERQVQVFHPNDAKYGDGTVPALEQISMVVVEEAEAGDDSGSFSGRWAA